MPVGHSLSHSRAGVTVALAVAVCVLASCATPRERASTAPAVNSDDVLRLTDDLFVLCGTVNTGVLVHGDSALLFDCDDSATPERLTRLGVRRVESIHFTQFRRPNTAGGYAFPESALYGPAAERECFEKADEYWAEVKNRWHLYKSRPGSQVPAQSMPLAGVVRGGEGFDWNGHQILVMDTPGMTDGAVSYAVKAGGKTWLFCGDVISAPGQVWDLHSLQKGFNGLMDYHGFLGAHATLLDSLKKIRSTAPETLIPSHGRPFAFSDKAIDALTMRIDALWRNYVATSALNHYFPKACADIADDPQRMKPASKRTFPEWVRRVAYTSFAVVSDSGTLLLVDCGDDSVLDKLDEWRQEKGESVEACWVTHYHDDHVDALHLLADRGVPVWCDAGMAPVIENPARYYLPCIDPFGAPVARATADGEAWTWHEFTFRAYHFPGQTLYHGGLLVEGHGKKVFFAGDSLAPTGMDDYTAGNRVFLGPGLGMRRCFDILREVRPDYILNQHQGQAFVFTSQQLDRMESLLAKRQELIEAMTPWDNANFAVDTHWIRTFPHDQEVAPGARFALDVEFTNHGDHEARASAEAVLPSGWGAHAHGPQETVIPARTSGLRGPGVTNPDGAVRLWIECPADAVPGLRIIPVRVTWESRRLGQLVHALVRVR
jgi:glyoxylase-like metal-dependent hydrolase (beta-lactamase superfamily II)